LKEAVRRYARPANEGAVDVGVGVCLELGLLYLEQGRLDEAKQFFERLINQQPAVRRYRFLGQLGQAIVMAQRDEALASNRLFRETLLPRPPLPERRLVWLINPVGATETIALRMNLRERQWGLTLLKDNPKLREMIGMALEHNYQNYPDSFPPGLEVYRKPPGLPQLVRPGVP
jgi:hypothetical protein